MGDSAAMADPYDNEPGDSRNIFPDIYSSRTILDALDAVVGSGQRLGKGMGSI